MKEEILKPVLSDKATLNEVVDCLAEHIKVPMQGECNQKTFFEILVRALPAKAIVLNRPAKALKIFP